MNPIAPYRMGSRIIFALVVLIALGDVGSCAVVTARCARRGGTTVRNVFDWPVCLESTR